MRLFGPHATLQLQESHAFVNDSREDHGLKKYNLYYNIIARSGYVTSVTLEHTVGCCRMKMQHTVQSHNLLLKEGRFSLDSEDVRA